jgi:hypothetical protein
MIGPADLNFSLAPHFRTLQEHLCLRGRISRRPALLVVTDVSVENIAYIFKVT